ncbi:B-cell receptor CD22-like [Pangshura tecta]
MEQFLKEAILKHLEERKVIRNSPHGFIKDKSYLIRQLALWIWENVDGKLARLSGSAGQLSALCWTEMAWVLVAAFCLLSGAYAQEWGVTLAPGPLAGGIGSCVTIPCSFTYPAGWNVSAVNWTRARDQTVYHSDEARVHAAFEGRVRYLGDLQHNCSLRVAGLSPKDQGTYRFRFEVVGDGSSHNAWTGQPGQRLSVSADWCRPSLWRRLKPGPSLNCSVGATCPHRPAWYNRAGARLSPGQTAGRAKSTKLRISPSQLAPGAALRCQVEGYWDECDSDQPLGTVAPNVPRIEVSWPAGKAALREGDNFTLRCQAAALRPVAGYVWSRGDVWLPEARQDLRVDKAAVSDGGSYACGVWVSGPGWGYLSLSARESVQVQRAYAQNWGVTLAPGPLAGWAGSCVTIPCSFTYPRGWTVRAVIWTRDGDQTVYHSDKARAHAAFEGRVRYLGDQQHNCSLRVAGLRPSDQGTYHFRFYTAGDGKSDTWMGQPGQQLSVSAHPCQPSLGHRLEPGPSLTCSMGATCPHRPSWYDRDGAQQSPGQTAGGAGATELQISPSQLAPGAALRCQVAGYRDECDSAQSQPLGTGWNVSAVNWTRDGNQTVYHSDEARVHADFKGRVRYLGDLQHNCSLRVAGLRPSDQGTYHFQFEVEGNGSSDGWTSDRGQQLTVSAHPCQPSLGHRLEPGPSLNCSVGATCPHRPSWYDRDGAQQSPGQTPGGAGATELRISPSQLAPGAALRCQVDGYRDECDSAPSQPLGTVAPNVPRVEVLWPAGKAALRKGDGFTLRCQAAALWPIARYVWSRGDVWLPEARQDLRVDKAAVSDGGSYACGVWVSGPGWGYLSLSARESVQVQYAPTGVRVTAAPGTSLREGESVTLTCSYNSSLPAPTSYAWYWGDWQLEGSQEEMVWKNITVEQAREYCCQAANGIGKSRSLPITITLRCKCWGRAPKDMNVTATLRANVHKGDPVNLTCHFSSHVPADITSPGCQCLAPGIVACVVVAILLLVILNNVGLCYLFMRGRRQAGAEGAAEAKKLRRK